MNDRRRRLFQLATSLSCAGLLTIVASTAIGRPVASRRACRAACRPLQEECSGSGQRRACRRSIIRRCRREGLAVCAVVPSSTTSSTTTSTTVSTTTNTTCPAQALGFPCGGYFTGPPCEPGGPRLCDGVTLRPVGRQVD